MKRIAVPLLLLGLVALLLWQQEPGESLYEITGTTMGTTFSIKLVSAEPEKLDDLTETLSALLLKLDRELMSTYARDSELSRFNNSDVGEYFPVSPELLEVVRLALEISSASQGAFDVTVGPLVNRWGFGPQEHSNNELRIPSENEINSLLLQVGYEYLEISTDPPALKKQRDIYVDLSGIAKGYAVDKAAELLEAEGIVNYFVEIGGELRIRGQKPGQSNWVPAMERPEDTAPQVHALLDSRGEAIAIAGSGDYRNYFAQDSIRYSHEIDPRTGYPIAHNLAAVYVLTDTAAEADALATTFMIMGLEASQILAEELSVAAYFIVRNEADDGFESHPNSRFAYYLQ
ncbi:MAG: FAD:protein FMN transferase [Pseudomonadales bacterium]|nr:FAD:protein FMN transferase [Pseudomonadales bacterium]